MTLESEIADAIKKLGRPRGFYELTIEEQKRARRQVCRLLDSIGAGSDSVTYITDNATYFDDGWAQFKFDFSCNAKPVYRDGKKLL